MFLALVGKQCSGKGEISTLMDHAGHTDVFVSSSLVYWYLDRYKGGSRDRDDISAAFTTVREFFRGWNGWMLWVNFRGMLRSHKPYVVYDGVRRINVPRTCQLFAWLLRRELVFVVVEASDEVRFARHRERKRPGKKYETLEAFLKAEQKDKNELDPNLVRAIAGKYRNYFIRNETNDREVLETSIQRMLHYLQHDRTL